MNGVRTILLVMGKLRGKVRVGDNPTGTRNSSTAPTMQNKEASKLAEPAELTANEITRILISRVAPFLPRRSSSETRSFCTSKARASIPTGADRTASMMAV
jgi:hypothetical protein